MVNIIQIVACAPKSFMYPMQCQIQNSLLSISFWKCLPEILGIRLHKKLWEWGINIYKKKGNRKFTSLILAGKLGINNGKWDR
jgi:hypothetical protein